MGQTSDQIERHIQETRNDLGDNITELEDKVKSAMDWRAQFEERPMTMIALAFGGGILLSALLPGRRSTRRRTSGNRGSSPSVNEARESSVKSHRVFDGEAPSSGGTWSVLKDALIGVATSNLSGFVEDLLPGFKQEFTKAKTGKSSVGARSSASGQPTWQKANGAEAD